MVKKGNRENCLKRYTGHSTDSGQLLHLLVVESKLRVEVEQWRRWRAIRFDDRLGRNRQGVRVCAGWET